MAINKLFVAGTWSLASTLAPEYGEYVNSIASTSVDDWIFFAGGSAYEYDPVNDTLSIADYATTFFLKADGNRLMDPNATPAGIYDL